MQAAATLSGCGLITGSVTQQFDVDAAFVDSIGDAQQAAGLIPDHVVSSFSGPLMVASPDLQSLFDVIGSPDFSANTSSGFNGKAEEKLVLYVFGRPDLESSAMLDEAFEIKLVDNSELANQPLVVGAEPSSASLMGLVSLIILSVRRRGGFLKEKDSPIDMASLDDW